MNTIRYNPVFRYIHFGLVIFGISSLLTAELAEESGNWGFWVHSSLGIFLSVFILLRLIFGFIGSSNELGFSKWRDKIRQYKYTVKEDFRILIGLSVPEREIHEGIAGIVQAFGLFTFGWMCISGLLIFVLELSGINLYKHLIEEAHEFGQVFVITFLFLHIGAVVLHYIKGNNLIGRINPL